MSQVKMLELRDEGTFIPILCVDMNPSCSGPPISQDTYEARRYLLRRCGYPCDGRPNIIMTRLDGNGQATNDPYAWKHGGSDTFPIAHAWIIHQWEELKDGDVVDVEFILGKRATPKVSERVSLPLD